MKKFVLSLALMLSVVTAFAQSSTEGKDFWVALTLCAAPSNGLPEPFIAVSTKKTTMIRITNPGDPSWPGVQRQVRGDSWAIFDINDIPLSEWYPTAANSIDNAKNQAGQTHNYGLHVTASEDVSVFAALRMTNSFDAANILPTTALQQEYIAQDYPPYIKPSDGDALSMFTILATENNTQVQITPATTTQDGHAAGTTYTVTLNAGQTYYVISRTLQTLSGSHVVAQGGKKIAVFQGDLFTQIPGGKAARDCTYEQAMPVDYWGNHFVVTRSKEKDANRIRVTALEDGTQLKVNGQTVASIDGGQTYEFELSNNDWSSSIISSLINQAARTFSDEAVFLESSCPVAVYSYDVSNGYKANTSEMDGELGDPSMVWIAPIEQRINRITFGVCGTNKTSKHFIDIACLTADAPQTFLMSAQRPAGVPLTFQPVPGNPLYSYARVFLVDDNAGINEKVFTLSNPHGVVAHVYGNGNDESYAYSVGSAAVKRGVNVDGLIFVDGARAEETFCLNTALTFNAQVGSDIIDRVDWDFGDGVTLRNGPVEVTHTYEAPGWYDVTANVSAHRECPETTYPAELVSFTFRVTRPDTIRKNFFICEGETFEFGGHTYTEATQDTAYFNCDSVVIFRLEVGKASSYTYDVTAHDQYTFGGQTYYESGTQSMHLTNVAGCDSLVTVNMHIVTCLDMYLEENYYSVCGDDDQLFIGYHKVRGDVGDAEFVYGSLRIPLQRQGIIGWTLPIDQLRPGHYQSAYVAVADTNCQETLKLPLNLDVLFPASVFERKWDDVLAALNKDYNGGYDVVAYQWYLDGMPIIGATSPVYYVGPDSTLVNGGLYAVELTTVDGVKMLSCPQLIEIDDDTTPAPTPAPKRGVLLAPGVMMLEVDGQQILVR